MAGEWLQVAYDDARDEQRGRHWTAPVEPRTLAGLAAGTVGRSAEEHGTPTGPSPAGGREGAGADRLSSRASSHQRNVRSKAVAPRLLRHASALSVAFGARRARSSPAARRRCVAPARPAARALQRRRRPRRGPKFREFLSRVWPECEG